MNAQKSSYLVLMLGVLGASCSGFCVRYSNVSSTTLVVLRMSITVVLFAVALLVSGQWRQLKHMTLRQLCWCMLSGLVFSLHLVISMEAMHNASLAASTVLLSTEVIFVALGGSLLGSRVDGIGWLMILTAFAGSALVAFASSSTESGPSQLYGCIMAICGAVFAAAYTLIGRQQRSGGLSTTCYTFVLYSCCAVSVIIIAAFKGEPLFNVPVREYFPPLGQAVLCTFMGHSLFSYCLKYLQPAHVAAAKLMVPVIAGLVAIPVFGEILSLPALLGCAIVLLAVLSMTLREARTNHVK